MDQAIMITRHSSDGCIFKENMSARGYPPTLEALRGAEDTPGLQAASSHTLTHARHGKPQECCSAQPQAAVMTDLSASSSLASDATLWRLPGCSSPWLSPHWTSG